MSPVPVSGVAETITNVSLLATKAFERDHRFPPSVVGYASSGYPAGESKAEYQPCDGAVQPATAVAVSEHFSADGMSGTPTLVMIDTFVIQVTNELAVS
jgi:hypothetical protein